MKNQLRITPLGIAYLKENAGVDLLRGANLELEAETIAHVYVAATQHWDNPPTFEEAMKADVIELFDTLGPIMSQLVGTAPAKKKRARKVTTGG